MTDHTGRDHTGHQHTGQGHEGHEHTGQGHEGHQHTGQGHEGHQHTGQGQQSGAAMAGERVAIPVKEEQLNVDKRETELGEVRLRKNVTEEEQRVPVELRREEVRVERQAVANRPLREGEDAFTEQTISVPIRGEEAVVTKEAVVTGEVVVNKEATTERREVTETLRKEQIDVDESYKKHQQDFQQDWQGRQARYAGTPHAGRTWADAEPNYQYGYSAANDASYQGREFEDAEPDLRNKWGASQGSGTGSSTSSGSGDAWENLREEIRTGWNRARGR